DSADNNRAGLNAACFPGIKAPGDGQSLDVVSIDLSKGGIVIVLRCTTVSRPILLVFGGWNEFSRAWCLSSSGVDGHNNKSSDKEQRGNGKDSQCSMSIGKQGEDTTARWTRVECYFSDAERLAAAARAVGEHFKKRSVWAHVRAPSVL